MTDRPWLVRQAGPPARRAFWWMLRVRGIDVTEATEGRSCVVLAAHPDDETLGCGATIMRKRNAGTPVQLVIATDGRRSTTSSSVSAEDLVALRAAETIAAAAILGLAEADIVRLDFEDAVLEREVDRLWPALAEVLDARRPDEVLVTSVHDPHPDHAALGRAARRAVAECGRPGTVVREYPIWQWRTPGTWFGDAPSTPTGRWEALVALRPHLVSTDGYLLRKQRALDAYRSQVENLTGEPGWWSLDRRFLVNFFRSHELFLPVDLERGG